MQKSQFTDEQIVAILQQAEKGDKSISADPLTGIGGPQEILNRLSV